MKQKKCIKVLLTVLLGLVVIPLQPFDALAWGEDENFQRNLNLFLMSEMLSEMNKRDQERKQRETDVWRDYSRSEERRIEEEEKNKIDDLKRMAENGNSEAQFQVGDYYYEKGKRAAKHYTYPEISAKMYYSEAGAYFTKAAQNNHPQAQIRLGLMYALGLGVTANQQLADELFQKATQLNDADILMSIAKAYANEVKNKQKADEYYMKAALFTKKPDLLIELGKIYALGDGVEANQQMADLFFQKASKSNDTRVLTRLGVMYARGHGTAKNKEKSIEYFKLAADLGNHVAKRGLKEMQKNGELSNGTSAGTIGGGTVGGIGGAVGGFLLGQAIIPIPILGGLVGSAYGLIKGAELGSDVGSSIVDEEDPYMYYMN